VLEASCSKVNFEVGPSTICWLLLVPPVAGAHEVACCKYLGVAHVNLKSVANCYSFCLRKVSTILNLLEQGLHWLLGVPCLAYVLKSVFEINRCDADISKKEVLKHFPRRNVIKSNHVIIQYVEVHWFKKSDNLFFKRLLYTAIRTKS
jgi:hypothetical protein